MTHYDIETWLADRDDPVSAVRAGRQAAGRAHLAALAAARRWERIRAAKEAVAAERAERAAYEAEQRAHKARERRERLDTLGRLVRCAGGWITERERDTVRAALDVQGALTAEHMERAGAYLDGNRWIVDDLDWESAAGGY